MYYHKVVWGSLVLPQSGFGGSLVLPQSGLGGHLYYHKVVWGVTCITIKWFGGHLYYHKVVWGVTCITIKCLGVGVAGGGGGHLYYNKVLSGSDIHCPLAETKQDSQLLHCNTISTRLFPLHHGDNKLVCLNQPGPRLS